MYFNNMTDPLSTILRLVRCPKCHKVLPEPANTPVYVCGECNTVLKAKRIHISLHGRFAPRPSSEFASTNNKAQRVGQDKSASAASNSKKKRTREQEDCKEINTSITLDDLRQHYGCKRKDVAESLGAGRLPDQHGEENPSPTCETLSTRGQTEMENEIVEGPNASGEPSDLQQGWFSWLQPELCWFKSSHNLTTAMYFNNMTGRLSTILRLVRCLKCHKVLPELANIPVYMCRECNTVLKAKRIHISLLGRFAPRPSALPWGGDIVGPIALSSSEFASTNNKAQRVRQDKSGSAASDSKKKRTREQEDKSGSAASDSKKKRKREQEDCKEINTSITLDDLRQHYGRKRKDVAESLGVSVSTLKRTCRQYGIKRFRKKAGRLPDQHGEENPSPTCKTLSTKGQTEMENEIVEGPNEAGVSSECEFQLKNQWSQFSPYPNSDGPVLPHPHITSTQILGENMGSLGDWRDLFASLEEPLLQVHVSGSMWTVPPCLDEAPSRLMPTIAHTTGCSDDLRNLLPWVEETFSAGHVSGSFDWTVPPCSVPAPSQPMPTIANTTGSSDDLRNLLPLVEEPFSVGYVSGSIDWTVPPCFVPAPSQPMPTIAHTTGSSDDLRNLLALMEEPFSAGQVSGSVSGTGPSCSDPALSQLIPTIPHTMLTIPRMMPPLTERQDTRSVKLRATYGDTTIKFNLPLTSGISELNKEVLKRLEFELGRFRVEYEDEDGVLILIACDEDVRDYLQFLTSSGNQVFKPLVLKKVPQHHERL